MTKKNTLAAIAERMYIFEQMTIGELASQLQVAERTVRYWKDEHKWDEKKKQFLKTKEMFHQELYNFARKLMATIEYDMENNNKIDSSRMFTFSKILPLICKIKAYEDDISKKEDDGQTKEITPDFIKMINEQFLGIKSND